MTVRCNMLQSLGSRMEITHSVIENGYAIAKITHKFGPSFGHLPLIVTGR